MKHYCNHLVARGRFGDSCLYIQNALDACRFLAKTCCLPGTDKEGTADDWMEYFRCERLRKHREQLVEAHKEKENGDENSDV